MNVLQAACTKEEEEEWSWGERRTTPSLTSKWTVDIWAALAWGAASVVYAVERCACKNSVEYSRARTRAHHVSVEQGSTSQTRSESLTANITLADS